MNRDFAEMLAALSEAGAEFMVIGAYAVAVYGRPRATGDLDIWVRPIPENARKVWQALIAFGAPLDRISVEDLASADVVFQIGVAPNRIDILTTIGGVEFDEAWTRRTNVELWNQNVPVIGRTTSFAANGPRDARRISPT